MAQGAEYEELVGFGGEGREPRVSVTERLRRRPWLVVLLVLAVVAGAAVAVAVHRAGQPDLPTLMARTAPPPDDVVEVRLPEPWQAAADGRPSAPVNLDREVDLEFGPGSGTLAVYGVTGPGIAAPTVPVFTLDEDTRAKRLEVDAAVDCEQVPLPVPADAYGVAVRVTDGARSTRGTLGAGAVGREWASAVQVACGSWLARTHLRMSEAVVRPDPSRPRAQLTLTVTNDGDHDAYVGTRPPEGPQQMITVTTTPAGAVRVPAGGSARLAADVVVDQCDDVAAIRTTGAGTDVPLPVTSDVVGVYASVGPASGLTSGTSMPMSGFGPTGVLLSPVAAEAMSTGMRDACGGVRGFIAFVAPSGTSYDPEKRVLTVRLFVNAPPGRVSDLQLVANGTDFGPNSFEALTARTPRLVPDYTGQSAVSLRYRAPELRACSPLDTFLPGFDIVARIPAGDGLRTVRFSQYAMQWDDQLVRDEVCGR